MRCTPPDLTHEACEHGDAEACHALDRQAAARRAIEERVRRDADARQQRDARVRADAARQDEAALRAYEARRRHVASLHGGGAALLTFGLIGVAGAGAALGLWLWQDSQIQSGGFATGHDIAQAGDRAGLYRNVMIGGGAAGLALVVASIPLLAPRYPKRPALRVSRLSANAGADHFALTLHGSF